MAVQDPTTVSEEKPSADSVQAPAIKVTDKAVQKIREAFAREGVSGGLRLGVIGGGCSGLSYQFKFAAEPKPRDHVFDYGDVKVFIDPKSMLYLDGASVDYVETLEGSGFKFNNPQVKSTCGCGSSFSA